MNRKEIFIGLQSKQKSLRNRLIPQGRTQEWIEKEGFITEDEVKEEKRQIAKEIMDDFYRDEIHKALKMSKISWDDLFECMIEVRKDSSKEKELKELQKTLRKAIKKLFEQQKNYKDYFKGELLKKALPDFIKNHESYSEKEKIEKQEVMNAFHSFTGLFGSYWENRSNVFTDEEMHTAISFRIVHENAEIFLDNMFAFQKIQKDLADEILKIEEEQKDALDSWCLNHIYTPSFFGFVLDQDGIDFYNNICGIVNLYINLCTQQKKIPRYPYQMRKLHKQILSKAESSFEIPQAFENDLEVYRTLNDFIKNLADCEIEKKCLEIISNVDIYNYDQIYLGNKDYTYFSQKICSDWSKVPEALSMYYDSMLKGKGKTKEEKVKQAVKNDKHRSLGFLESLLNAYLEMELSDSGKTYILTLKEVLDGCLWDALIMDQRKNLIEAEEKIQEIKQQLDGYMQLKDWFKQFLIEDSPEKDTSFYSIVYEAYEVLSQVVPLYNRVRNYVTRKPYETKKFKLYFGSPTLANGWAKSKEYDNNCVLFMRNGQYYLGIFNPKRKPDKMIMKGSLEQKNTTDYKKVEYYLLPGPNKMLPKVFFSKKGIEQFAPSSEILNGYEQKRHIKSSKDFDLKFCHTLIDFFKESIEKHPEWYKFHFQFSPTESYGDISVFYKEVADQGYRMDFVYISEEDIDRLVEEGSLYLFQIYNKDFATGSKGTKNLHTLYLQHLFSEENLKDVVLKLNGEAEIFYRRSSIQNPYVHKKGSMLINKSYEEIVENEVVKKSIPDDNYREIQAYFKDSSIKLSEASKQYLEKSIHYEATMDIVKDRRYSIDQMMLHLPMTINFKASNSKNVNEVALSYIKEEEDIHIIGIDRGERNLIYVSLIDQKGQIKEQKSFNIVNGFNYKEKLTLMENARQDARRNWKEIGKIKETKTGYLSQVIHEICQMVQENNAIIALEDLNYGFKRGRFKIERQVYQKFEEMLIQKLSYLADKKKGVTEDGGLLRGYQMAYEPGKNAKLGKQCGIMFYVPAAYTSKIDPTTGFADVFAYKKYTSGKDRKAFLMSFDRISYSEKENLFFFEFDYKNFMTYQNTFYKTKWIAATCNQRIEKIKKNEKWTDTMFDPTAFMKEICAPWNYLDGHDLKADIALLDERKDLEIINRLFYCFKMTMQMRNSTINDDFDQILSPVKNSEGMYFDSTENDCRFPIDADANGAYHIALKGLYLVEQIKKLWEPDQKMPKDALKLTNEQWFKYVQTQDYRNKE